MIPFDFCFIKALVFLVIYMAECFIMWTTIKLVIEVPDPVEETCNSGDLPEQRRDIPWRMWYKHQLVVDGVLHVGRMSICFNLVSIDRIGFLCYVPGARRAHNKAMHALNGNIKTAAPGRMVHVKPTTVVSKATESGEVHVIDESDPLRPVVFSRSLFKANFKLRVTDITLEDWSRAAVMQRITGVGSREHAIYMKLLDCFELTHNYLKNPCAETYRLFATKCPVASIIPKLRLFPMPGLSVKMWSFYCSLHVFFFGANHITTISGESYKIEKTVGVCFESLITRSLVTAMDIMFSEPGAKLYVDTTSIDNPDLLYDKVAKLYRQMVDSKEDGVPVLVVHCKCPVKDCTSFYPEKRTTEFLKASDIGKLYRDHSRSWKEELDRTVDEVMVKLASKEQYTVEEVVVPKEVASEALRMYSSGSLSEKMSWIRNCDHNYCNKATLDSLLSGLQCSNIKDTLMYTGAVQFPDLKEAAPHLEDFLDNLSDPVLKMIRFMSKQPKECVWVSSKYLTSPAPQQTLELEMENVVFPPDTIAVAQNITEDGDAVLNARIIFNPAYLNESQYFMNAVGGHESRVKKPQKLRSVTNADVLESELYKDKLVQELSCKTKHNNSLNIWQRKAWVTGLAPPALRSHQENVLIALSDIELGSALNHQFEIGNITMMSLKNMKKHRYCLVRNGHNVSYTLIKCSAGGGAFKNCPIKVLWLSESSVGTRHDDYIEAVEEDNETLYLRATKWHSIDTRMMTWNINQPLAVESRLSTVLSVQPDLNATPQQIVLNSLPTMPNTQDFSKLSGPLRNAIDSLDSVESEPSGITTKMKGLTVGNKVELWYTLDYLTTFMIGRVLHATHAFEKGGPLRNDATGTCKFKFPEFDKLVSHPELITNFRNAFHHVVKNKVNKLGPEARDFLAIVEEKVIYDTKRKKLQPGELFGCSTKDYQVLRAPVLDKEAVKQSLERTWAKCSGSKNALRYQWNIWYQLRCISYDQRHNSHMVLGEEDWWAKMFNTTLDEYLTATGSMESTKIDLGRRQARRKSTSVYELMVMIENNTNQVPMFLKGQVADMVRNQKDCVMSMGVLCLHLLNRLGDGALIRILDKDQVEGEREISALDVLSMLACSIHEKAWSVRNKHHPVDKILAKDKGGVLRELWTSQQAVLDKDETLVCHGRDCSRYGPNQDMEMLALNASIMMDGPESLLAQLACQSLFRKTYKPPETLASAYLGAKSSAKGVIEGDGILNTAFRAIDEHKAQEGLQMRGGMGQGILGIGASYSTSMSVQYANYILVRASERVRGVSSAQTSDDGADVYRIKKKHMFSTIRWISVVKQKLMCMTNNITNPTKSGLRFTSLELNAIRAYAKPDGELIETSAIFKMIAAKVAVPDTMSFVEDAIKANLYAADLVKTGIPAEIVMANCVHSLMLCYQLHKKWVFVAEPQYLKIPALLGGPIGPCFIQCCVTPLAPVLVFSGGLVNSESTEDLIMLSKCILRTQLLDEDSFVGTDTEFGDAPALYKKSVDALRFTRRPNKTDRKAFEELFKKGFSTGSVPNLIYTNKPVTISESTETFIHKLTTGESSQSQPNNKYLMTWGSFRKSFSSECIMVAKGSPMSFLLPDGVNRLSPEYLKEFLCLATEDHFVSALQACAAKSNHKALGSLTEGKLYDAMLRQMVSKFEIVGEVTRALADLHHHGVSLSPDQRILKMNPMSTSLLRSRRDVMNLEQEIKKKIFVELAGQPGVDYLFDHFGVRADLVVADTPLSLRKAMLLCDQYSSVIVDFLTLRDRQVTLRSKYSVKDDKSMVSQLLKYNMSYNKEYSYDDSDLLVIKNPPLKEFVSNFWQHDVEERAILINNSTVLDSLYNMGHQPAPIYLKSDMRIRKVDDLYSTTVTTDIGEPAVFEVSDTSQSSVRLIQMAHALQSQVLFTNNTLYRFCVSAPGLKEMGIHGKKVDNRHINTIKGVEVSTVEIINQTDEQHHHEILVPQDERLELYEVQGLVDTEEDTYSLTVVAESNLRTMLNLGGSLGCKVHRCVAPLIKMSLIDFDWDLLDSHDDMLPTGLAVTNADVVASQVSGDPRPSVEWAVGNRVSLAVAVGYLGSYGVSRYFYLRLIAELSGDVEETEEPYNVDRTFAQMFAEKVCVGDLSMSPFARVCVASIKNAPKAQPKPAKFKLSRLMRVVDKGSVPDVKQLDEEVRRKLVPAQTHEETHDEEVIVQVRPEIPEDTVASILAEEYDPFEDADDYEVPVFGLGL